MPARRLGCPKPIGLFPPSVQVNPCAPSISDWASRISLCRCHLLIEDFTLPLACAAGPGMAGGSKDRGLAFAEAEERSELLVNTVQPNILCRHDRGRRGANKVVAVPRLIGQRQSLKRTEQGRISSRNNSVQYLAVIRVLRIGMGAPARCEIAGALVGCWHSADAATW